MIKSKMKDILGVHRIHWRHCIVPLCGLWIGLSAAVAFAHHLEAAENTNPKVKLKEVLSVGHLDDDALFQWVGVVVDPSGQIYVTDAMDYSLKKFGADGRLLQKAGRKGQGPGEFLAPRLLARSDKYLFVTDQSVPGIQVFDHTLRFIRRIPIKIPIGDVCVLTDDRIAVVALLLNQPGCIHVYDLEGQILKKTQYGEGKKSSMMDWVEIGFNSERKLYILYNFQDRIEKFGADGGRLWSRPLLNIKRIKTKKIGPWEVPDKIIFKDLVLDSEDRLYILGGGHSENPSRDVYVLDPDGAHLTTFALPESSHCIYIDSRNFLYSRANDGITLKKYRIEWSNI
ncbi:MAG: 6-bladed beta-propeller [Candidatus Aminicenantes bacterium]